MKIPHTIKTHVARSPTDSYFISGQSDYIEAPLLIFFPGLDETGEALISLQTASFQSDFNVRSLVIPSEDLDDWDSLAVTAIALIQQELAKMPCHLPIYLCAESFGGCLALKVLSAIPDLFDRVVLVNSASSLHRVPWLNLGVQLFPLLPQSLYDLSQRFSAVSFLASSDRLSAPAYEALLASTRSAPKRTLQRRLALMREFSINESQLRQVSCPVLLVGAEADRILPSVAEAYRLSKIFPQSQVVRLPDAGHACLVEDGIDLDKIMRLHRFIPPLRVFA